MKRKRILRLLALLTALSGLLTGCGGGEADPETTAVSSRTADAADPLNIYCFQAGKADAFLLWNGSGAILIDTGESGFGKVVVEKLKELGIQKLDYLILTHFDKDHVGGAKKVLESVAVGSILQSNCPKEGASAYEKYLAAVADLDLAPVTVREKLTLTLGGAVLDVDPPAEETYAEDPSNNSSLIVTVTHGENRLLFTGDALNARLSEFLLTDPGTCVLVKLPHHGAWQSTLESLLQKTKPRYALITSSDEEPEDERTLDLLARYGVETFLSRTAPVQIVSDGKTLQISCAE